MEFPFEAVTSSPEETEEIGKKLAEKMLTDPSLPFFTALYGDLGVGKTAFTRGFASKMSVSTVHSPTFSLVNVYPLTPEAAKLSGKKSVCHFDLYRIDDEDALDSIGFDDYLTGKSFCLCEWCEKIPYALPRKRLTVRIEKITPDVTPDRRKITVEEIG